MSQTLPHSTLSLMLPEHRRVLVRSMVEAGNASHRLLTHNWHVVEDGAADVVLGSLPQVAGRPCDKLRAEVRHAQREPTVFPLHWPLRSTALFAMLNSAAQLLDAHITHDSSETDTQASAAQHVIEQWLRLRQASVNKAMLRNAGNDLIFMDAETDTWLTPANGEDLGVERAARLALRGKSDVLAVAGAPAGWERHVSLKSLLWNLATIGAPQGLLASASSAQALELRGWPYLIAKGPEAFGAMARALRAGPMPVAELARNAHAAPNELAAFVNGCLITGYLRCVSRPANDAASVGARTVPIQRKPESGLFRALASIRGALGLPIRSAERV